MNRNTGYDISAAPIKDISRSVFDRSHTHKTTFNAGRLIPFYREEILPNDTYKIDTSFTCRMATPLYPVMDNAYLDIYYFFCPNRLIWDNWEEFQGENKSDHWTQKIEYKVPMIGQNGGAGKELFLLGSIADYMNIPIDQEDNPFVGDQQGVNALYFRAYAKIYNDWFRNENLQDPLHIYTDSVDRLTCKPADVDKSIIACELGGMPARVNRFHDYFSSCLPSPQKGNSVELSLGGMAPVVTGDDIDSNSDEPMRLRQVSGEWVKGRQSLLFDSTNSTDNLGQLNSDEYSGGSVVIPHNSFVPANFWADTTKLTAITVNDLRLAFATQRMLELDARSGSRYTEILQSHWGVRGTQDYRLQRTEYLGGGRYMINVQQVLQTSSTVTGDSVNSPLGQTGAYSLTGVKCKGGFTHTFTEHGILLGVCCVRTDRTYSQGIPREFMRRSRYDYYDPIFANIGEQAVKLYELFADYHTDPESVFGYQEAWAEYRYKPDNVSGYFRPNVKGSLASWHYSDYYKEAPTLSEEWCLETDENVARTLAVVDTSKTHQFIADFCVNCTAYRAMPVKSIPGLIDHN